MIHQDNTSTIMLVTKGGGKLRTNAIKGVILEGYENEDYDFDYVNTDGMTADVQTKPMQGTKYLKHSKTLLNDGATIRMQMKSAGVRWINRACGVGRACECSRK